MVPRSCNTGGLGPCGPSLRPPQGPDMYASVEAEGAAARAVVGPLAKTRPGTIKVQDPTRDHKGPGPVAASAGSLRCVNADHREPFTPPPSDPRPVGQHGHNVRGMRGRGSNLISSPAPCQGISTGNLVFLKCSLPYRDNAFVSTSLAPVDPSLPVSPPDGQADGTVPQRGLWVCVRV